MNAFIDALFDPSVSFIRNAMIAGLLSSILFGLLGAIVTVQRISGLAGAISHAVLGGIGMALFFSVTGIIPWITPVIGAMIFAVIAALIIGIISLRSKQREDTVINAIWAVGMSIGVLFMAKTPGYTDPMSYLFGNILLITDRDLVLLAVLDAAAVFFAWRFYPQIEASAFDREFARSRGVNTDVIFLVILAVTAVAVVLLQTFVGIVMVIAMLTLPAGTAGYIARNLASMMWLGFGFSAFFTVSGICASWSLDLPAGATVVVFAGAVFLLAAAAKLIISKLTRLRNTTSHNNLHPEKSIRG
ncbi:MAG TPA: metal ABC transporter permease [Spirochaetota bacterium]|nr:metal ABC transporter permease [Spirochaetota bacterium]